MTNQIIEFTARIPKEVEEALSAEAKKEDRSRSAQLVRALRERYGLIETASEEAAA